MSWVPLHVHSQYSILDASASVKGIAKRAAELGLSAAALTDHGNMYGAVDFYKACTSASVKPIIGCDFYVSPEERSLKKRIPGKRNGTSLVLLAKDQQGYHNLCKLTSIGFLEGFYYTPRIDTEMLEKYSGGLVCLTGAMGSLLADTILEGNSEKVDELIAFYKRLFGDDLYFELQRHQMSNEDLDADGMYTESWLLQKYQSYVEKQGQVNTALLELSERHDIAYVATNGSHYLERDDWRAHEILLNVQSGEPCEIWEKDAAGNPRFRVPNPKRKTYSTHELDFKSQAQMAQLFADLPLALENTLAVAEKCNVKIDFETKHYPVFVPPELENTEYTSSDREAATEAFLREECEKGIARRYTPERLKEVEGVYPGRDPLEVVRERLEYELGIIVPKGMCDYLLIVWDFIHWAKGQGIPVGPGRGSGAGSIILYLIGVTDIEPLRFGLFFERFINPERLSYPDIDVDICMDRRAEVINYTLEKYGNENVAQIITFGTMKAKSAIKDVGRVLSIPLPKVNAIAKLVPDDLNITLATALEKDADLNQMYQEDEDTHRIIDLGMKLEGSIRSTGIHAAGIIICGESLTNHIPVCVAKDSEMPVTQYSMKPVEQVGMLKVDFLGLKTLTSIQLAVEAIEKNTGRIIDWMNMPFDDSVTFDLLNQGRTSSVFQLESTGMQDLARQLHLDKFEEIIAVGALYRPGPMDMIPSFIARKHGREPIEYDHEWLEEILSETYGIMVYQEQVMMIAQKMAKYSLGEGDVLRRAMGKKEMAAMAQQREKFRVGSMENGVSEEVAMAIFDNMEKFAAYGFNKSHATAYGYLSYVTGFLKANYPGEWFAALMTCDRDDLTKVSKFIREGQSMGIEMLPPDVNEAREVFVATDAGIRFAMSGIKGVGSGVVETIVAERDANGPFKGLYDFFQRMDAKKVGKKNILNLVEAGAFDFTGWSRDAMRESIEPMFDVSVKERADDAAGYMSLFSLVEESDDKFNKPPKVRQSSTPVEILLKEKELLGFFLTGHPMDEARSTLKRLSCVPLDKVATMDHDCVFRAAFLVESVQVRISAKTQKKFAILGISDGVECFELPVWPELFELHKDLLEENRLLYAVLSADKREESPRLSCHWLGDLVKTDDRHLITACDQAFDKAKASVARMALWNKKGASKKEKGSDKPKKKTQGAVVQPNEPKKPQDVTIQVDLAQVRLSHVLQLKTILQEHSGTTPVLVNFASQGRSVALLHVSGVPGVTLSPKLTAALKKLPAISTT